MAKRIIIFAIGLAIVLAFFFFANNIFNIGGKNFSDLKSIYEKHGLDGYIAPGSLEELRAFENDLLSLKALAQQQKSRQTEALVAMIEYRIAVAETQRAFLNSIEEARFIDYYDASCSKETSLKKTIGYIDDALTQADLSIALANNFANNYKDFVQAASFDLAEENKTINSLKTILKEKKNRYKTFCI